MSRAIARKSTDQQLALTIFEDAVREAGSTAVVITQSKSDITYRKNNVLIDVNDLGLLARRAVNVMHFLASQSPDEQDTFDVDLGFFKFLLAFESRNYLHLKRALREAQKSSILVDQNMGSQRDPDWVSVPLVGAVGVAGGRVVFDLHRAIRKQLRDPTSYTYLSLRITAAFSSSYAHALYERMQALAYKGTTEWFALDEVKRWLGATTIKTLAEYKNFKRYALDKAVEQINTLTDLFVRYETRSAPGTKRIADLRFHIRTDNQGSMVVSLGRPAQLKELYDTLVKDFGLGKDHLDEIISNEYPADRINAAVEFTRHRMRSGKIKAPGLYLMNAIRDGLTLPESERSLAVAREQVDQSRLQVVESNQQRLVKQQTDADHDARAGLERFAGLPDAEREVLLAQFIRSPAFKVARARIGLAATDVNEAALATNDTLRVAFGHFVHFTGAAAKRRKPSAQT